MGDLPGRPERAPLGALDPLLAPPWAPWPLPAVVESTPSTMVDVEGRAREGAPEGTVVVAEEQTAGRGRRGRTWESAARAGLWWSLLLRPTVSADQLGWLPLVMGVGVARGIQSSTGLDMRLKWPNDVLAGTHKVAGILAERLGDGAVVVGVGINVDHVHSELPDGAASLRTLGRTAARESVLITVLESVADCYRAWLSSAEIVDAYTDLSVTLGSDVRADLGDRIIEGRARALGPAGELIITDRAGSDHLLTAGDVTLIRSVT
jgi:BirA family transcriptional regulator, biotin operon repressor / biotin---[acetyl-CoA-carboxylase] ligase